MDTKKSNKGSETLLKTIQLLKESLRSSLTSTTDDSTVLPATEIIIPFNLTDEHSAQFKELYAFYKTLLSEHRAKKNTNPESCLAIFDLKADNFLLKNELSQLEKAVTKTHTSSGYADLEKSVRTLNHLYNEADLNTNSGLSKNDSVFKSMVMESATAMAILKGENFCIDIANKSMLSIWRKEFNEVKGKPITTVFPELIEQKYPELLRNVMTSGKPHREEESMAYVDSHDGRKTFYLNYEYSPFYSEGKICGVMCTVNDVTASVENRKQKEVAQARLTQLVETLPVAMYTLDENGYMQLFNSAAVTLWGRTPQIGKDRWCGSYKATSVNNLDMPVEQYPIVKALRENKTIKTEAYIYRPNGDKRHVIAHPQPLHDENGKVVGASNVLIDITDTIEAAKKLSKSEEKFRLLSAAIPYFIWTIDSEKNPDYCNNALLSYSGLSRQDIVYGAFEDIVHPEEKEKNRAAWQHSFGTGNEYYCEQRLRRFDGVYRWFQCRAIAQKDEQGNVIQWIGTSIDIHDSKTFQHRLETIVEERTLELKKANMELESINKELSSFAYISSHDLQEPLRKIQTFASIILNNENENLSDAGKRNFTRMQVAAAQMTKLIKDLLTYSRTNADEKVFEDVDLHLLLNEIADEFNEHFQDGKGKFEIDNVPVIKGIPFQLKQLFTNLLSNSVKFKRQDLPLLIKINAEKILGSEIDSSQAYTDQEYLKIQFQDNGIGFSQEYAGKIFEVFQRLHPKNEYEGTGIGLAICTKIAEIHQAIITASSKPGKGALFTLYFPV